MKVDEVQALVEHLDSTLQTLANDEDLNELAFFWIRVGTEDTDNRRVDVTVDSHLNVTINPQTKPKS